MKVRTALVVALLLVGTLASQAQESPPVSIRPLEAEADSLATIQAQMTALDAKFRKILSQAAEIRNMTGSRFEYDFERRIFVVYGAAPVRSTVAAVGS